MHKIGRLLFPIIATAATACAGHATSESSLSSSRQTLSDDPYWLADENGSASAFGAVAYGAGASFFYRTMNGTFTCNNETFGDPDGGVVKACYRAPFGSPPIASTFLGDSPSGSYNWSDQSQGLAHDANNWFITQPGRLWKVPLSSSLAADEPSGFTDIDLPDGENNPVFGTFTLPGGNPNYSSDMVGYNHFGDLDYHSFGAAHALFIPVQGSGNPIIAVFDADTLDYVTSMPIPAMPPINVGSTGAWVAVRPGSNPSGPVTVWTSAQTTTNPGPEVLLSFDFDVGHDIIDLNGNWAHELTYARGPTAALTNPQTVAPVDTSGNAVTLKTMQGGAFNEDGESFYALTGYCDEYGRIHVFHASPTGSMTLVKESYNPADPSPQLAQDHSFVYETHPSTFAGFCTGEESEGIDYFDTRGNGPNGVPDSQLHVMLVSNDEGDDHIFLKHYSFPPAPQPPPDRNLALGSFSLQSSTAAGLNGVAALANDGNTDGNFSDGSVNHTDSGWNDAPNSTQDWPGQWWWVDLGAYFTVDRINIYNRTDCCTERLSHYNVLALDPVSNTWKVISNHSGDDTTGVTLITLPVAPVQAEYIMLAKTDENYLHVAEVQVMGH